MYTAGALILALAPDPTPLPFHVADVEVVSGDQSSHLLLYDELGEVSGELVIWADPAGRLHVDAGFADGLYLSARIVGETVQVESDDSSWWCPVAAGSAACSCLPLLVEEWEGEQCFGIW